MGQYHKIKCATCGTSIETTEVLERCPVCDVYMGDQLAAQGGGTGIKDPAELDSNASEVSD